MWETFFEEMKIGNFVQVSLLLFVSQAVSIEILVKNDILNLKSVFFSSFVVSQAVSIKILVKNDILNLKSAFFAKKYIF